MLRLAVLANAYRDESLLGFIHRLAHLNALPGRELLKVFKEADAEILGQWLATQESAATWAGMLEEVRSPNTRPIRLWNSLSCRFCPDCLHENGYWRTSWGLTLVTCCIQHGGPLLESCPLCEMPISMEAMRDNCCTNCSGDLAKHGGLRRDAPPGALWLARHLEYRLNGTSIPSKHVTRHLRLDKFNELALRLGVRDTQSNRSKPLKLEGGTLLSIAGPISATAGQALQKWPTRFFEMIERIRCARARTKNWKIHDAIGPLYHDIYRHLSGSDFDFLRAAFADYILEHWDGPVTKRNRNLHDGVLSQHRRLSIKKAGEALAIDEALIQRLVDCGEIASSERCYQNGRVLRFVDRMEIQQLEVRPRSALTLEEAAKFLALSKSRVRQLIEGCLIVVIGGAPSAGARWWIDAESVKKLCACHFILPEHSASSISVSYLAKHLITGQEEFVGLIRAISTGELMLVGTAPSVTELGNWLLDKKSVESWFAAHLSPNSNISVVNAAKQLGIKQEVAYALIRIGLLASVEGGSPSHRGRSVKAQSISQFRRDYVMGPELANNLQRSPKTLPRCLVSAGFLPVAGPNEATALCRQYVWRRSRQLMDFVSRA